MFKKIIKISLIGIFLSINLFCATTFAEAQKPLTPLFERITLKDGADSKVKYVNNLPEKTIPQIIASVIYLILSLAGSLALVSFTVGGIMMIASNGADEKITKGKMIILYSVIALAIIAASFAVVTGVTQISKNFYTPPPSEGGNPGQGAQKPEEQKLAPGSEDLTADEKEAMQNNNL